MLLAICLLWPVARHPTWWLWSPGAPHSDLAVTHWPNAHFTRRMLWEEGQFPLWRPTIMSGAPFAANPLAGLCYPFNWLLLFLPWLSLEMGFNLSALAHLWLAGVGMHALMRRGFGVGTWGALAAGVAYEAAPKLLAHLGAGHVGWAQAWAWLPVVIWASLQVCKSANLRGGGWAAAAGAALAIQFCADVRMAAYTLIAAATLLLCKMQDAGYKRQLLTSCFLLPTSCFLLLASCQWLPMLTLLPETTRSAMTFRDAAAWSLPWRYLAGLLLADHGGFHEWMTYAGVSVLMLAVIGITSVWREQERRWLAWWLGGLVVSAAWFSLGENGGLFQLLWRVAPGIGLLRVPPRAWVLVTFALAALAGFGVDAVGRQGDKGTRGRRRRRTMGLIIVGALPPMLVAGYWATVGAPPLNLAMFGLLPPLTLLLTPHASRITPYASRITHHALRITHHASCALLILLIALDLWVVDRTLIEARAPEDVFAEGRAAAEWLAAQPGRFRVYSPSYSIPQHTAELYGLELADGVDPLQLRAYAEYLTRAAGLPPQGYSVTLPPFPEGTEDIRTALRAVTPDAAALGLLGVRYMAAAFPVNDPAWQWVGRFDEVYVYENLRARPLPEVENGIVLADGSVLFHYNPWPVYAGWGISSLTALAIIVYTLAQRRRSDG